jgi:DNA-binding transcriptional ArsR family regulator
MDPASGNGLAQDTTLAWRKHPICAMQFREPTQLLGYFMSFLEFSTATAKQRREARAQARLASDFLKAMSHEGRLLILCLLVDGEVSVSEIEAKLDMPQAAVSQQLARLRLDGLVEARRDGRNIYYALARPEVTELITTLSDLFCKTERRARRGKH